MTIAGYALGRLAMPASISISATNGGGGPTTVNFTAGNYYPDTLCAHLQTELNSQRAGSGGATWAVSLSTTTGLVTISMSSGTFSITWTSTALRDALGFAANITTQTSVTAPAAARGIFVPDCPLALDSDPRMAPMITDHRQTQSPTGFVLGLVGNIHYRLRNIRWSHVTRTRTWNTSATDPSWERFVKDVQIGQGHSWFTPSSRVRIIDQSGSELASDAGTFTWQMKGVSSVEPRKVTENWTGMWRIEIPELVSDGT